MRPNVIRDKSYAFAIKIVLLCGRLKQKKQFVLSDQLLKSGTSIGANVAEGLQGQSRRDFIAKLSISLKEAHETHFWIQLLRDTGVICSEEAISLLKDIVAIIRILTAILRTSRSP